MSRFEFKLPDIGEGVTEGEIVNWLVQEGDKVAEDQEMVEVMTDKATVTIGAPRQGTIAELRANMESQMEDAAAERGRPLNASEVDEMLKKMGPPMVVAARYQPQRWLIGPTIFPIYLYVLRLAVIWASIIYIVAIGIVVPLTTPNAPGTFESVLRLPDVLITVAASITLIFAILEYIALRHPEKCPPLAGFGGSWSPASLPPLEKPTAEIGKTRSFAHAVAEVVFGFLVLCWLALIPRFPFLMFGPGAAMFEASPYQLSEVWWTFYWWILALNVVQVT